HPNYWYWMQLRTQEGIKSIRCELTETAFSLPQEQPSQRISTPTIPVSIYPNPFNPRANISFELSHVSPTSVKVYNIKGQLVTTLADKTYGPGKHTLFWDGDDQSGSQVASGIYLVRIQSKAAATTRKLILKK
ncbi:MAG TPA: T9SS type A sorting domain-containing protein, partial [Candidatus Cloacimonadota bacterium]|nr:T9SS type A sorting domain-containing protein [Candidatus Cloacimonadota bacterium]